jgi:hypothetical protein
MSRSTAFVAALLLAWNVAPVFAQSGSSSVVLPGGITLDGTPEERAACVGDVHRFCNDYVPDNARVLQCLQTDREKISRACRTVLQNHGQ